MFSELVKRNSRRSRRENGLFFTSLLISIIAFYIILSLSHQDVMVFLQRMESNAVNRLLTLVPVLYGLTLFILFFLVYYANRFQLARRRIGIAAQSLGIAEGALEEAKAYTKGRVQFGKPISKFQNTQFTFADMAMRSEAGRLLTYQAAVLKGEGKRFTKEAAMAKLFCSEHAMKTTTKALQMFGGYGYTNDYPMERMMRDAKITEIYEGTSEVQRIVISANMGL